MRCGTGCRDGMIRAEALLTDPDVNAVYVATPPSSHEEYVVRAAAAGKPVLVEKPMGRTHQECLRMIAACERARIPLYVAYYRRSLPAFLRVKALLDDGAVGELRCVSIRLLQPPSSADLDPGNLPWRVRPEISGGGYFVDLASHQFDFLDFLFGRSGVCAWECGESCGALSCGRCGGGGLRVCFGRMRCGSLVFRCARDSVAKTSYTSSEAKGNSHSQRLAKLRWS